MIGEILVSRCADLSVRHALQLDSLRSKLSLDLFDCAPLRQDHDRHAHYA
jgi:hypothetical protein